MWWKAGGPAREDRTPPAGTEPPSRVYGPGEYPVAVPDPSPRPEVLAGQLIHHMEQSRGQHLFQAVADMNRFHCLTPAQRSALLHVLADTDGVVLRGEVTDRQDRPGLAVSMDDRATGIRHLLVFAADTGTLLSYEQVMQVSPPTSPVRTPALLSYVVYLACEQTAEMP